MADNFLEKRQEAYDERKRKWIQSQKRFPVNKTKINQDLSSGLSRTHSL